MASLTLPPALSPNSSRLAQVAPISRCTGLLSDEDQADEVDSEDVQVVAERGQQREVRMAGVGSGGGRAGGAVASPRRISFARSRGGMPDVDRHAGGSISSNRSVGGATAAAASESGAGDETLTEDMSPDQEEALAAAGAAVSPEKQGGKVRRGEVVEARPPADATARVSGQWSDEDVAPAGEEGGGDAEVEAEVAKKKNVVEVFQAYTGAPLSEIGEGDPRLERLNNSKLNNSVFADLQLALTKMPISMERFVDVDCGGSSSDDESDGVGYVECTGKGRGKMILSELGAVLQARGLGHIEK